MADRVNLDGKFHGVVVKNKNGVVVTPDQWIVFLAKDNALMPTLAYYLAECERIGASAAQLESIKGLMTRAQAWRDAHPDACKVPDIEPNETIL